MREEKKRNEKRGEKGNEVRRKREVERRGAKSRNELSFTSQFYLNTNSEQ
jgi:hypothetical protein